MIKYTINYESESIEQFKNTKAIICATSSIVATATPQNRSEAFFSAPTRYLFLSIRSVLAFHPTIFDYTHVRIIPGFNLALCIVAAEKKFWLFLNLSSTAAPLHDFFCFEEAACWAWTSGQLPTSNQKKEKNNKVTPNPNSKPADNNRARRILNYAAESRQAKAKKKL